MHFSPISTRLAIGAAWLVLAMLPAGAQQQRKEAFSEPVFRVASDTPAKQVSARAVAMPADSETDAFFDLEPQPGEHPLAPCKRLAERVKANIEANVQDYSCLFSKVERIDGELQEANYISMQVMHNPFSVHMLFRKPKKGQECLYVEGQNNGNMKARAHGWRGTIAGVLTLDPNGSLAMAGQRHPITKAGMQNLTNELITIAENDMKFGECEVRTFDDRQVDKRPTVMMEIVHPVPRREFKFHVAHLRRSRTQDPCPLRSLQLEEGRQGQAGAGRALHVHGCPFE